jgi:hypothetical protein
MNASAYPVLFQEIKYCSRLQAYYTYLDQRHFQNLKEI